MILRVSFSVWLSCACAGALSLGLACTRTSRSEVQADDKPDESWGVGTSSDLGQLGARDEPPLQPPIRTAYLPAQCYVKTSEGGGRAHNPCYVCHTDSRAPNYADDGDLQRELKLPEPARKNPWRNLFNPPSTANVSDEELLRYVRESNYFDPTGKPALRAELQDLPAAWDEDDNGKWDGYVPDAAYRFDDSGFDRREDGSYTGWRAYSFYPFPGAFLPTNGGSMGDALIRLPAEFQQDVQGRFDLSVYRVNLAIVQAMIQRRDVPIDTVVERSVDTDLDDDGQLSSASRVVFSWQPGKGSRLRYVGQAGADSRIPAPSAGLFPQGTEFLHSVRYLDVGPKQEVRMASRMKELRYARKHRYYNFSALQQKAMRELQEKATDPDRVRQIRGNFERGVTNGQGWTYQAFIENPQGRLRPQTYEELTFCVGCHGGVGVTDDSSFSFARKVDERRGGWFHATQDSLRGVSEPRRADGHFEYALYLEQNGAADDFRSNEEVSRKFFAPDGTLSVAALAELKTNVEALLIPSATRALALDRAYLGVVLDQSFTRGRDALLTPVTQAHEFADEQPTGVNVSVTAAWAKPSPEVRAEPSVETRAH